MDSSSSTLTFSCGSARQPGSTTSSRPPSRGSRSDDGESGGGRERKTPPSSEAASGAAATDDDELTEADISVKRQGAGGLLWDDEEDDPYVSVAAFASVGVGPRTKARRGWRNWSLHAGGDGCCVERRDAGGSLLHSGYWSPLHHA